VRRLTVNLPDAVFGRLESARNGEDLTLTQTLVRAVNLYAMMRDIARNGGKVLIETDGGRTREVTFL
jgi:hypothetical protein